MIFYVGLLWIDRQRTATFLVHGCRHSLGTSSELRNIMKYDKIRETAINSLFVLLTQPELTNPQQRIINDCATLLINGRTPEQVSKLEIELFNKINGDNNG